MFRIAFASVILTIVSLQVAFSQDFEKENEIFKPVPYDSVAIKPFGLNSGDYITLFSEYVNRNIRYPSVGFEEGIQGVVHVSYVIDKEGLNTQIKIINDVHPELGKEVIRVISSSPRIISGRDSIKNRVSVLMEAKVHFVLNMHIDSIIYEDNVTDSVSFNIRVVGYLPPRKPPILTYAKPTKPNIWHRIKRKIRKR